MSWVLVATAAVGVTGTIIATNEQKDAARRAAGAQTEATTASIEEQRRQFDEAKGLLQPFVEAGGTALTEQMALSGLSGQEAQQAAIQGIEESPQFQSIVRQGEEGILSSASATGGLRGGNVQAALGQFRPQVLSQQIQNRFTQLGGIAGRGQQAAAGLGAAGIQTGQNVGSALQQQGNISAQQALALGQQQANMFGGIAGGIGQIGGMLGSGGGF